MSSFPSVRVSAGTALTILFLSCLVVVSSIAATFIIRKAPTATVALKPASRQDEGAIAANYGKLPLHFEKNEGQTSQQVKFVARGPGYDVFLTGTDAVLSLRRPRSIPSDAAESFVSESQPELGTVLRLKMLGANPQAAVKGNDELQGKINYFVGDDPNAWLTNIPTYRKVDYENIFPGVDLVYYGNRTQLEYDFVLAPGAKVSAVKFRINGADRITVGREGELRLATKQGEVQLRKPQIYQVSDSGDRQEIAGAYLVKGSEIGFKVASFDPERPLVIDPVLAYATLLGAGGNEQGNGIAVDAQGYAYVTGLAVSGFPTTAGAFQTSGISSGTAFVTKLDQSGTNLIYSTYLGGSATTSGNSIAVDAAGNAVVAGNTAAGDFPTLNPIRGGRNNLLITGDGGTNWSPSNIGTTNRPVQALAIDRNTPTTMYAGAGLNGGIFKTTDGGLNWVALNTGVQSASCTAIVVDPVSPNIVYAGLVSSTTSQNGVYKSVNGGANWSLANSGVGTVGITALAIDPQAPSTLYVSTSSNLFKTTNGGTSWSSSSTGITFQGQQAIVIDPVTPATVYAASGGGVFKTTNGGANWANSSTGITNSSLRAMAIDPATPATLYVASGNGLFKSTNNAGNWSPVSTGLPAFISLTALAIDPSSTSIVFVGTIDGRIFKTTNGGSNWNIVYTTSTNTSVKALVVDPANSAKVFAGVDSSSTSIARDAFITKLNSTGSGLVFSTLFGGVNDDVGHSVALDASGNVFVVGQTFSADFPTLNAAQPVYGDGTCGDGFVVKLNSAGSSIQFSTYLGGTGCDFAHSVAVDGSGGVCVTGFTVSSGFTTPGAFQTTLGDSAGDGFVARLTSTGGTVYRTYLGGNGPENDFSVAADLQGNAYVTGSTGSQNFPRVNPVQAIYGGSSGDAFVTKLNDTGTALVYSTFLGGSDVDSGRAIAVDAAGNAYVVGHTRSFEFPLTPGAVRTRSPFFKSFNGGNNWSNDNYGFFGTTATALAIDPTAPSKLLAGTSNRNFRSTDGGRTWTLSMTGVSSPSVTALVINPAAPATVYLASNAVFGSQGVFKSTDGGVSWTAANNGLNIPSVNSLAIDPVTPTTLYAATGSALYKSIDGAGSWNKIGPQTFTVNKLTVDPLTPTTLYAAENGSGGVLKSTDSGANWQPINTGITSTPILDLVIDRTTPSTLYAASFVSVFKSTNGGSSWTAISTPLKGPLAIDPSNSAIVYAGGTTINGLFKSTDGGNTWNPVTNGLHNAQMNLVQVNPANSSIVYASGSPGTDEDAFITKLSPSGTSLVYSTLFGGSVSDGNGSPSDQALAVALDPGGNAYLTGVSRALDFPTDANAYQPFNRGLTDAFVVKLVMSYILGGQVLDAANAPVNGAEVVLSDGSTLTSLVTESDGSYQFSGLREGGNFTVSASKPPFAMAPASQTFNNLSSNQTQNFVATPSGAPFFTISGQITNNNSGLSGVTVTLSGSQQSFTTTNSGGNYSFTLASGGNYTVTPTILGFSFSPANQTFNNLSANQTANFTATRQNFVVTNANDHGAGSLRQTMLDANAVPGLDTITFNIPGSGVKTIDLLLALPIISDPVVIDAATQPGYSGAPLVELNGAQTSGNGFEITAGNSTIRGFIINRFSAITQSGIRLGTNGGNTIQANYIGTDATGTVARSNRSGILIASCSNNLIGGTTASARNVISGNTSEGIAASGNGNQIQGNFIGTNASGSAAIPNAFGVTITGFPQFSNSVVGGTVPGAGNVISGNSTTGVVPGVSNTVQGNLIGTDATGLNAVPNGMGINANNVTNTLIGGLEDGARNVISGNTVDGVYLSGNGSKLQGNFIGTDITGARVLGNGGNGVVSGTGTLVGGTVAAARNIISGNGGLGNIALGFNSSGGSGIVQGNYIGTDLTGNVALTNPKPGISIQSSTNVIGGLTPAERNIISGNTTGIQVGGSTTGSVAGNVIQGNYIGLNQAGTGALPNTGDGIKLDASSSSPAGNNVVGGIASGAGNRISFNGGNGVLVSSGTGNSIRGNSIVFNGTLGIDLLPAGITANDQGDADAGANNRQNFPALTTVTPTANPTTINGTLNSTANTAFRIDFYSNQSCDSSGSGEGAQFLDTTTVTTAADGNATINYSLLSPVSPGTIITATATDPNGNTSEFSRCTTAGIVISFGQATYTVSESGGSVDVTVNRSGDTAGAVNVDYATSADNGMPCSTANGLATPKCDFTTSLGTVNFAAGQTSQTVSILISQDSFIEGSETFTMALSNPTGGAALGTPSTTTITITDDATEPPTNLIDDARNFVRQHYHDFLNREPDASGWDFWTNQITSCGSDVQCNEVRRIDVSASFFLSIEFQQTGYLVERFYKVGHGDGSGTSTFGGQHQLSVPIVRANEFLTDTQRVGRGVVVLAPGWEQALENNKQAYALEFVQTSRFISAFPTTMTPAQFVDKLNVNAGNVLSATEQTTLINLFGGAVDSSNTTARAQAVRQVAEDTDLYNAEYNRAFVLAQYFGYLRRNPNDAPESTLDYTGYDFWLTKLNQFNGNYINAEMVKAFLSSIEYRQRFGP